VFYPLLLRCLLSAIYGLRRFHLDISYSLNTNNQSLSILRFPCKVNNTVISFVADLLRIAA